MLRIRKIVQDASVPGQTRPNSGLTPELSRAARGLLGWTQQRASRDIGIATCTLADFEAYESITRSSTLALIESVYVNAGVTFVNDADRVGVLLDRARIVKKNAT
jgi:hypothetical protein